MYEAAKELSEALSLHIVPLFAIRHGKQELHGNGFLVSSGKNSYLVSAAHVFDRFRHGIELFFPIKGGVKRYIPGEILLSSEGMAGKSNRLDVAVSKLEGEWLPPYPDVNKQAISIDRLIAKPLSSEKSVAILLGFPKTRSKPNLRRREVESEVFLYYNIFKSAEDYPQINLSSDRHIVIPFNKDMSFGPDGNVARNLPHPNGMSGSPIWLLDHENPPSSLMQIPVIGVFIEYHKIPGVLVGTHIRFLLDMIDRMA